jgi:rhodanese-related sulfurtransferase
MNTIQPQELHSLLTSERPIMLIDVRSPAEYAGGHIPGARNMPLGAFTAEQIISQAAEREIVAVCQSGARASRCYADLENAGARGLKNLSGGTQAWIAAGFPIESSSKAMISIERQVRMGAGFLVLLGLSLGVLVAPIFLVLSAFVGAGLIFAGATDWCGMALLLARMPWNQAGGVCQRE